LGRLTLELLGLSLRRLLGLSWLLSVLGLLALLWLLVLLTRLWLLRLLALLRLLVLLALLWLLGLLARLLHLPELLAGLFHLLLGLVDLSLAVLLLGLGRLLHPFDPFLGRRGIHSARSVRDTGDLTEPGCMDEIGSHLRQHDHWTFLVGLALVLVNVRRGDRRLSALAALFLLAAFGYDCWEVLDGRESA
jgi:hypothetical protein